MVTRYHDFVLSGDRPGPIVELGELVQFTPVRNIPGVNEDIALRNLQVVGFRVRVRYTDDADRLHRRSTFGVEVLGSGSEHEVP